MKIAPFGNIGLRLRGGIASARRLLSFGNDTQIITGLPQIKAAIYNPPTKEELGEFTKRSYAPAVFATVLSKKGHLHQLSIPVNLAKSPEEVAKFLAANSETFDQDNPAEVGISSSFDQEVSKQFINQLDPVVVANLGLHKSLTKSALYNYCIPKEGHHRREQVVRNRSKTLGCFPVVRELMKKDETGYSAFTASELDEGLSERMANRFKDHVKIPQVTKTGFMKRIAQAPFLSQIKNLRDLLMEGLKDGSAKSADEKEYGRRISNIPLPNSLDNTEHAAMWRVVNFLGIADMSKKAKSKIFLNIEKDWVKNAQVMGDFNKLMSEYSQRIADDVLLPAYIAEFRKRSSELSQDTSNVLVKFDDKFVSYIRSELVGFVKDSMLSKFTPKQIVECATRLNRKSGEIFKAKSIFVERMEECRKNGQEFVPQWHKIFPDQEINGVKFRAVTSEGELEKESNEMNNCVKGFLDRYQNGARHIISGVTLEGERFSVLFDQDITNKGIKINEVSGIGNKSVSQSVKDAVQILCKKINSGEIELNSKRGKIYQEGTIDDNLGFKIEDKACVQTLFKAYRDNQVLPAALRSEAKDPENFCQKLGFQDFVEKRFSTDLQFVKKPSEIPASSVKDSQVMSFVSLHDRVVGRD